MSNDSKCKKIFITGSSSGLGRAVAKLFAGKGWDVVASMRNPEKETELKNLPNVELVALDVTKPKQILDVVKEVTWSSPVDVVFNNAGYGLSGPLEGLSEEQIERIINTNMRGAILVTKAFTPHFREKRSGLFITTTSIGGLISVPFNSMYHATKWGLEGWCESMAFELNQFGIGMKIVEPGGMKTDFFTRSFDSAEHPAYGEMVEKVMRVFRDPKGMEFYSHPDQIAQVVYEAATDGSDKLRYVAGADAQATYDARLKMGDEAFRKAMDKQFFG